MTHVTVAQLCVRYSLYNFADWAERLSSLHSFTSLCEVKNTRNFEEVSLTEEVDGKKLQMCSAH